MYGINDITADYLEKVSHVGGKEGLNFIAEMDLDVLKQVEELRSNPNSDKMPLFGIPIFIKDNIDVKGLHTTAGSLAIEDNIADKDAPVIQILRDKGAVILGKTNMTEFANYTTQGMPGGYSSKGGQVINAINSEATPSGSSSGSGVVVSSGLVDVAIGTDTSFSVIGCAQANGICGLKPPIGVLSVDGIVPISKTLDSAGFMANNISNALLVYGAMRDDDFGNEIIKLSPTNISKIKIALNKANEDKVSEGQLDFINSVMKKIKDAGGQVDSVNQPPTGQLPIIMKYEFRHYLEEYLKDSNASLKTLKEIVEYYESHPDTMLKYGDTMLRGALEDASMGLFDETYLKAMSDREELQKQIYKELQDYDAAILTGPSYVMHLCGFPSVTVASSVKNVDGLNRGIIMYGVDEKRLYRAALALEQLVIN